MAEQETRRSRRMPWAFAIGAPVTLLGLFALLAGGPTPGGLVILGVGLLLTCTGLIQRSIEQSRR